MKSLKQILQKAVIYPVIIGSLFLGAYRCGDGSEPNPDTQEDAQVQVDTGHPPQDGGLEDKLVYPDANGDNEKPDAGIDTGYDANLTDTYDGGLDASDVNITDVPHYDGGDLTDVLDGGYDANDAGDVGADVDPWDTGSDGGQGVPPVVIIETKDEQGNVKDTFNVGEWVIYDLNKSYDPDCEEAGTCGESKGMYRCEFTDGTGGGGYIGFSPSGNGTFRIGYGSNYKGKTVKFTATCYDKDDNLSTTESIETLIK